MKETIKKLYWKIKKIFGQIVILLLIGFALYWVGTHLNSLNEYVNMKWVKSIFIVCLILYFILFLNTISSFINSNLLHVYNAADSKNLSTLNKKRKYYWFKSLKQLSSSKKQKFYNKENISLRLEQYFQANKYIQISHNEATSIYEKDVPFYNFRLKKKKHRIFFIYKSLLNILIVDHLLTETESFIKQKTINKPISQNIIIFITDMNNEEEILSAGTGIVNYLSAASTGYLYPIFIDTNYGHIFYPQDNSLMPWYKRISIKFKIIQIKKQLINTNINSTNLNHQQNKDSIVYSQEQDLTNKT